MAIDELYMQKQYRCVLTDLEHQFVIELLPSRAKELVTRSLMDLSNRERVEIIGMDMWRNYLDSAREALPRALAVIDKFHVVKLANEVMEDVRRTFNKQLAAEERRVMKSQRRLLLMRSTSLTDSQRERVAAWLERFPYLWRSSPPERRLLQAV